MPKREHVLLLIPYLALWIKTLPAWITFCTTEYVATWEHLLALVLLLINLVLYYWRFRVGVMMTGGILLLTSFHLLTFGFIRSRTSVSITWMGKTGETPPIEAVAFLLLLLWIIIHLVYALKRHIARREELNNQ